MQKELYLTSSNRKEKIDFWLKESQILKSRKMFKLDLTKTALLVLDMQNFFTNSNSHAFIPSAQSIIEPIYRIIKKMVLLDRPIIFTRHVASNQEKDLMKLWWRDSISANGKESEITEELPSNQGIKIVKNYYSAFMNTELENILNTNEINQVLITGVMSHLCCETTLREAFMRGFEPFFIVDATATYTEQLHLGTIRAVSHGFGVCLSSEEILDERK